MSTTTGGLPHRIREGLPRYQTVAGGLWALALFCYVGGDAITTVVSMQLGGVEANPVALFFMDIFGRWTGLFVNKVLVTGFCVALYRWYPDPFGVGRDPFRLAIPAVMIVHGLWITSHNLSVIATL